ncbi:GNAT family N-acetyltransferase [Paenibacillus psychroresistens]|nr:GNAT family N-acetyltransferase [Paenibacillus psychroresistens]
MIREAEQRDRDRIEELYKILIPDDNEIIVKKERIDQVKQDPHNFLYVNEIEGRVEGTVLLTICLDVMYGNRPYAVVEYVIVDPDCRGMGVGKELFNHVEDYCKKIGCREILLMSNVKRLAAHEFLKDKDLAM